MNFNIKKVKIFVTVPKENLEDVRTAMCNAGAGVIGNYSFCSTSTKTIGTFIPNDNANPYIGEQNKLEVVEEEKLEVICDVEKVKNVIQELRKRHPYEEPAIDIIPLIDESEFMWFYTIQNFFEKVSFLNFRYLFRYLLLGFSGALGSSQKQKSAKKCPKMLSKAPKIPQTKNHVAVVKSIKIAVEEINKP